MQQLQLFSVSVNLVVNGHSKNPRSGCRVGFHDALARCELDTAMTKFIEKNWRRWIAERPRVPVWEGENCTVFRYHGVHKPKISRNPSQLR